MSINPDIKLRISESGHYYLQFIPEQQIERYLSRLNNYIADYEVCAYRLRDEKIVYKITFLKIEALLLDQLENAHGILDKGKFSLPTSENIIYFSTTSYIFIHVKQK